MEEKINILLVEDNPADARLIDIYLRESYSIGNYNLVTVGNLSEGVELLKKNSYTVIILDLSLPDSFGLDTFRQTYQEAGQSPVIVLTGLDDETVGINAMKLGAQDFLIKGEIKSKELSRSINYSIERYKLLKELSEKSRKLEEQTADLLKQQLKLAEAQKLAHLGSWEWDIVNNTFNCSDELYHIHGLMPYEMDLTFEGFLKLVHDEDRENTRKIIEESYQKKIPFDFHHRIKRPDSEVRIIHERGEVIADKSGIAVRMLGTGQDVTDRVREEEMENLVMAATKSFNAVVITDKTGKIEWVNEGFTKLTGYKLDDLKNTYGELLRQGDEKEILRHKRFYTTVSEKKEPITYESKNYTNQGAEFWVITTLTPVLGKNKEVERVIAIDSDITQRKKMEAELLVANKIAANSLRKGNKALNELLEAKKQLEESMKVKERFLANMSHEIRTPMNAIIGFTDLMLKTPLTAEQGQYIDAIKTSGKNLLVIINDILDFSKIESGKITFEEIEMSLSQVISIVVELMLPRSIEKNIKLSTKIDERIPDQLIGDPTRLNQILLNLLGNAIKFTEKGEVKLQVDFISEEDNNIAMKFSVSDTGIGIPEDKLVSIFDGFSQARDETTRKYGGTGLGLAIAKQLVELQGGSLSVKSKINEGSSFIFYLTFKRNQHPSYKEKDTKKMESKKIEGLDVLLVEDNVLNQILAKKILSDWKWNVDLAENGLVAVEKVKNKKFDVILMDIQLPEMDGYETTRYIRTSLPPPKNSTPIIAMTAHAISGESEKCFKAGMNGYVSKPFKESALYDEVISHVRGEEFQSSVEVVEAPVASNGETKKITDMTYLTELAKGNKEFIHEMLTVFMSQTPESIGDMEKYLEEKNWKSLRAIAHKMKPSFAFVGVKSLQETIVAIEEYSETETNLDKLPALIARVKEVSGQIMKELEVEIKAVST